MKSNVTGVISGPHYLKDMSDNIRLYEFESVPLKIVLRPKAGHIYYTSFGDGFECVSEDDKQYSFNKIHNSVLRSGELIEDLSPVVLKELFWPLTRTELKLLKYELKNTRRRV